MSKSRTSGLYLPPGTKMNGVMFVKQLQSKTGIAYVHLSVHNIYAFHRSMVVQNILNSDNTELAGEEPKSVLN